MKKLVRKIILLFFIIILEYAALVPLSYAIRFQKNFNYFSVNNTKQKYLERAKSPKVILVGGSNLAFGVNSQLIEKSFGLPVVNMGLHAGLGLDYMISEVKNSIHKGDTIVLVPEYEHFYTNSFTNHGKELAALVGVNPVALRFINSPHQMISILQFIPTLFETIVSGWRDNGTSYSSAAFNQWGDIERYPSNSQNNQGSIQISKLIGEIDKKSLYEISEFNDYCKSRGATMIFVYPAYAHSLYSENQKQILNLNSRILALRIKVISQPIDFVFPDNMFIDSGYHLGREGVKPRTEKLIELISNDLQKTL